MQLSQHVHAARPSSAPERLPSLPPSHIVDSIVEASQHAITSVPDQMARASSGFVHYYEEGDPAKALHLLENEMVCGLTTWTCSRFHN